MKREEFIEKVKRYGALHSANDAEKITRVALATLGERLSESDVHYLGAQLAVELKGFLNERKGLDRFSLEEFYNRVAARGNKGYPEAVNHSRVVMKVLRDAVGQSVVDKILENLPAQYSELFGSKPQNPLSPSQVSEQ